jgi:tetratricopeptide (TPR) repeat protein
MRRERTRTVRGASGRRHHFLFIGLEQQLSSGMINTIRPAPDRRVTPLWVWLLMLLGFGLIFYLFAPEREGPNPPPGPASQLSLLLWIVAPVVALILLFAIRFFRHFDPGVRRANKRAQAGDLAGAIEDLREQMEDKGPTQVRANTLGLLLLQRERWAEAAAFFRKAAEFGKAKSVCQANLGLALLNGGRPEEALPVLEEALHLHPQTAVMTCLISLHTCRALAELGRWDEAHEQFRLAEEAAGTLREVDRAALGKAFRKCHQKLEQQPRDKPKPEGLAEL